MTRLARATGDAAAQALDRVHEDRRISAFQRSRRGERRSTGASIQWSKGVLETGACPRDGVRMRPSAVSFRRS
jgi:hypothetical protein